jgi:anti-sigma28 factor (negative regulator of flagellin synthesis)
MSIRIHNESPNTTGAAPSTRADELSRVSGSPKSGSRPSVTSEDTVEISSFSGNIAETNNTRAIHDAGRVQQLASLYRRGSYQVDSLQLSRSIVSNSLGTGLSEGKG